MLPCFQGGNRQGGMVHIGGTDVDDVDVGVTQNLSEVGGGMADAVIGRPFFECFGVNISTSHDICIGRGLPTGHVRVGNPTDANHCNIQRCHIILLCIKRTTRVLYWNV